VTWQVAGVGRKIHREQLESGLPGDLAADFHALSEWASGLPRRFGAGLSVRLVDVASLEGFFKSLVRRISRYPAFVVDGKTYVGRDFSQVDALIAASLAARGHSP
jgi:hypothetical protein